MTGFCVIAHRGASSQAPENTLAAFARAATLGVTEVETDVRKTRDGRLALWHDAQLRPKVDLEGRAEDHTLSDLKAASLAPWFEREGREGLHPPRAGWKRVEVPYGDRTTILGLVEYLKRFGAVFVHHIELKGDEVDLPELTLDAVRAQGVEGRTVLTSFHFEQLERARRLDERVPIGYLCGRADDPPAAMASLLRKSADAGFQQFCPHARACTRDLVEAAHQAGMAVRAWGVATLADARHVISTGADGTTVNWPDALLEALANPLAVGEPQP